MAAGCLEICGKKVSSPTHGAAGFRMNCEIGGLSWITLGLSHSHNYHITNKLLNNQHQL